MPPRKTNRFVDDDGAPVEGASQGKELQAIEKKYTMDEAVALFKEERNKLPLLRNACIRAEALLKSGQVGRNKGNLSSLNHDSRVAIVAFTLDEPFNVCYEFNRQSRSLTLSSWNNFPYKGMWLILNKAILLLGKQSSSLTVYRGIRKPAGNFYRGMDYCFRQVTSTSLIQSTAQEFSGQNGTLFIIKGPKCLSIQALSEFDDENEYIIPAFDTFKVTNVDDKGSCRKIYLQS